jgi:predicted nucleic acid-binding Zn ribbon protein
MGFYVYCNPETGEVKEVLQKMNDEHVYEENGVKWSRVFTVPQVGIDTVKINPFSKNDFLKKTEKNGTIGSLLDRSKEMSEKRKDKEGYDPVQQKYFSEYSAKRKGRKHTEQIKQELKGKGIIE